MGTRVKMAVAGLAMVLGAWVGDARAAQEDDGRIGGPELVKILQDAGYRASLETDSDGDPLVRTGMAGWNVVIHFYDCQQGRCGSLQFSTGIDLEHGTTMAVVNKFNTEYRYGRVHLDDEADPFLVFDFEVLKTDHAHYVASQVDTYEQLLGALSEALDAGDAPQPEATPAGS